VLLRPLGNVIYVCDSCISLQAFEHYQRFGMGEENTPMYLSRGVTFDIRKSGGTPTIGISRGYPRHGFTIDTRGDSSEAGLVFRSNVGQLGCYAPLMSNPSCG
jgi:hypothetical protein